VITGSAAGEASRCTPDPRALLRRAARTPPALALAGYVGLVVVAGVLVIGYWWLRRKTLTVRGERRVLSG
jgi:xanthosine utilization system XapX-like protein